MGCLRVPDFYSLQFFVESLIDCTLPGCLHRERVDRSAVIHNHKSAIGGSRSQVLQVSVAGFIIMPPINDDEVASFRGSLDNGGDGFACISPDERHARSADLRSEEH